MLHTQTREHGALQKIFKGFTLLQVVQTTPDFQIFLNSGAVLAFRNAS